MKHAYFGAMIMGALQVACNAWEPVETTQSALRETQGTETGVALRIKKIVGGDFRFNPERGSIRIKLPGSTVYKEGTQLRGASFRAEVVGSSSTVYIHIDDVQAYGTDAYTYTMRVNGSALCPAPLPNTALSIPGDLKTPPYAYTQECAVANFSCGGVIKKCIDWGYKPWTVGGISWPHPGNAFGQCLFLARADYCGQDVSNTENNTLIDVYDIGLVRPVNTRSPGEPPLSLEALWAPASAGMPRRPAALCLAKQRWDALPLKGTCDLQVADPRLRGPVIPGCPMPVSDNQFCGERTLEQWLQYARTTYGSPTLGLLVSESSYNDIGLYRWDNAATSGSYTTAGYDIYKTPTVAGLPTLSASLRYHCFEGRVYTEQELRVRPDLIRLFTYATASGDFVTTTATTAPSGYLQTSQRQEGYVVPPGAPLPPESAGLYLWQAAGRYVTSTSTRERPPTAQLLGYLPRSASRGVPLCDTTLPTTFSDADFPTPLRINCPDPMTVECRSGTGCADVPQVPPACGKAGITTPPGGCYPLGDNPTQYSAVDPRGQTASCTSAIRTVDTKPPVVLGSPAHAPIWPPNHTFRTVSLANCGIQIQDQCVGALDVYSAQAQITCVTSDEPDDSVPGVGDPHVGDIRFIDALTLKLRAQRGPTGDGRVYRIGFSVRDSSGNVGQGSCRVDVPHTLGVPSVDSGVHHTVCRTP